GSAVPARCAVGGALAAGGRRAVAVAWLVRPGRPAARAGAVLLAGACLAPLLPRPYATTSTPPVPPFFAAASRWLPAGATVLVLPYPTASQTLPLAWQAAAHMAFPMPGGYFIGPTAGGQAYVGSRNP